jgi:Asp-tRNA(Asn)/Glu-tRNA(Gln) amidotransferase A subunit family amidase
MHGRVREAEQTELWAWPAARLAEAVARKTISPVEIVDAVLARIERVDPGLNAFARLLRAAAAFEAAAPWADRWPPLTANP